MGEDRMIRDKVYDRLENELGDLIARIDDLRERAVEGWRTARKAGRSADDYQDLIVRIDRITGEDQ